MKRDDLGIGALNLMVGLTVLPLLFVITQPDQIPYALVCAAISGANITFGYVLIHRWSKS